MYGEGISWEGTVLDTGDRAEDRPEVRLLLQLRRRAARPGPPERDRVPARAPRPRSSRSCAGSSSQAPPDQIVSARLLGEFEPTRGDARRAGARGRRRGGRRGGLSRARDSVPTVTALHPERREPVRVELDGAPWRTLPGRGRLAAGLSAGVELDRRTRARARAGRSAAPRRSTAPPPRSRAATARRRRARCPARAPAASPRASGRRRSRRWTGSATSTTPASPRPRAGARRPRLRRRGDHGGADPAGAPRRISRTTVDALAPEEERARELVDHAHSRAGCAAARRQRLLLRHDRERRRQPRSVAVAASASVKPTTLWLPSHSGLFSEAPQRQSVTRLRSSNGRPSARATGIPPLRSSGPSALTPTSTSSRARGRRRPASAGS